MDYRLVINYGGQWDDLRYVGGDTFVEVVSSQPTQLSQPTRRQRACSVCHVLGHNRKTCPLVDHSQPTAGLGNPANGDSTH